MPAELRGIWIVLTIEEIIAERVSPSDAHLATDNSLDEWLMCQVSAGYHGSSTCKMGPESDKMAAVDQHGKVHGLEGLWVADASIKELNSR